MSDDLVDRVQRLEANLELLRSSRRRTGPWTPESIDRLLAILEEATGTLKILAALIQPVSCPTVNGDNTKGDTDGNDEHEDDGRPAKVP